MRVDCICLSSTMKDYISAVLYGHSSNQRALLFVNGMLNLFIQIFLNKQESEEISTEEDHLRALLYSQDVFQCIDKSFFICLKYTFKDKRFIIDL